MADEPEHISKDRVRGGETRGIGRYVLIISLILIVIAFGSLLVYYR